MQRRAAIVVIALIPGALTAYFSFESGGYFAGAPALVAAELLVLIGLWFALARRPSRRCGPRRPACRSGPWRLRGLGPCLERVVYVPARAIPEYTRALGDPAALVFFGMLPFSAQRVRLMAYGLAAAIVFVCAAAFLSRTVPDAVSGLGELQSGRLSYPLDYWNSLGLLAGLGIVLCGHFACASRDHPVARVLGAAAIPLLTATLYYTFSRGATWATLIGVGVYAVLARPRGLLAGALATVPPTVVALMTVNPADVLTSSPRFAADTLATGHRTALIVLACVVAPGLCAPASAGRPPPGGARHSAPPARAGARRHRRGRAARGAGCVRRAACARGRGGQIRRLQVGLRRRGGLRLVTPSELERQRPLGTLGGRPGRIPR